MAGGARGAAPQADGETVGAKDVGAPAAGVLARGAADGVDGGEAAGGAGVGHGQYLARMTCREGPTEPSCKHSLDFFW